MKYINPDKLKSGKLYLTNGFYDPYFENRYEIFLCVSEVFVNINGDYYVDVLRNNGKIYEFGIESCDFCELEIE